MTVLVAGFDGAATDRLTRALTAAGYDAAGVGAGLAPTLAAASKPEAVLVPAGPVGAAVRRTIEDVAPHLRFLPVPPEGALPLAALRERPGPSVNARPDAEALSADRPDTAAPDGESPEAEVVAAPEPLVRGPDRPGPPATPERPAPRSGPVLPQGEAPPSGGLTTRLTAQRAAKLRAVRFFDYHAILEVKPSSPAYVIEERYETLRRAFEPTSWPARLGAQELAELLEILDGLRDAHVVLGDATLRARYERAQRQHPASRLPPASLPTHSVPTPQVPR